VTGLGGPEHTPSLDLRGTDQMLGIGDGVLKTIRPSDDIEPPHTIAGNEAISCGRPAAARDPAESGTRYKLIPPTVMPSE
jgi:hypothetical protein